MKKILLLILYIVIFTVQNAFADGAIDLKINSIDVDTSNSMLFLSTNEVALPTSFKPVKLTNPNRLYFDINSATLIGPKQELLFSSGNLTQVKISQNSTNPNIVRVVMYFTSGFDTSKVKIKNVGNNIFIEYGNKICSHDYFTEIYRDVHSDSNDYYENCTITSQKITAIEQPIVNITPNKSNDKVMAQIQQAFGNSTIPANVNSQYQLTEVKSEIKKTYLKTDYHLLNVYKKNNGLLIGGFGSINIEKPLLLQSPNRIVYDLPNTFVNQEIRNKEYKLSSTDTLKLGQFGFNKARIVITTNTPEKYIPIHSNDNQTLLIADKDALDPTSLFTQTSDITSYSLNALNDKTYEYKIRFTNPTITSVKREDDNLIVYIFNGNKYNDITFKNSIKDSALSDLRINLMPQIGLRLSYPMDKNTDAKVYLGADGKTIKLRFTLPVTSMVKKTTPEEIKRKPIETQPATPSRIQKKKNGKTLIIIDPGHGGVDYGALRAGINEKDITLAVSQKLVSILKNQGYDVQITRNNDLTMSLQERVDFCENRNADLFISVHVNSSLKDDITGIETHYYHDYSYQLADDIQNCLTKKLQNCKNRGLFKSKFYVINHTTVPAVLVEIGFISNADERAQLVSEQRKQITASAIAEGVIKYLNGKK